jgi:hypothetical protein
MGRGIISRRGFLANTLGGLTAGFSRLAPGER